MDDALPEDELKIVAQCIRKHQGEDATFHGLRTRKAGQTRFIDFHLLVHGDMLVQAAHDLCDDIEEDIKSQLSHAEVTIHVEPLECEKSYDGKEVGGTCNHRA